VQKARTDEERRAVREDFLALAAKAGAARGLAEDLWRQMAKFTQFSFCRAHAASYGVLAWASAWLAAHHPAAHWVAALNNNQGLYDARVYLEQARREGVRILGPCVQRSGVEFTLEDGAIRVGLGRVFGLAEREISELLAARPFASPEDVVLRTRLSKPSLRALALCGAFDAFGWSRPRILMYLRTGGRDVPALADFGEAEKAGHEMELLGLSVRKHPLEWLAPGPRPFDSRGLAGARGRRVTLTGIMATQRLAMTAREEPMQFLTMEDEFGLFEVLLFPKAFARHRRLIGTIGPYTVTGRVEERWGSTALRAEALGNGH
jgi:DNA polymerase III alpha subunit